MKEVLNKFTGWLKTSFGKTDEVSSRRITAFWYTVLVTLDVITTLGLCVLVTLKKLEVNALALDTLTTVLIILVSGTGALLGITTIQNIAEIKKVRNEKTEIKSDESGTTLNSSTVNKLE